MGAGSFHYGGQAVIQGVMIRGKEGVTISVRQPNGQLNVVSSPWPKYTRVGSGRHP